VATANTSLLAFFSTGASENRQTETILLPHPDALRSYQ